MSLAQVSQRHIQDRTGHNSTRSRVTHIHILSHHTALCTYRSSSCSSRRTRSIRTSSIQRSESRRQPVPTNLCLPNQEMRRSRTQVTLPHSTNQSPTHSNQTLRGHGSPLEPQQQVNRGSSPGRTRQQTPRIGSKGRSHEQLVRELGETSIRIGGSTSSPQGNRRLLLGSDQQDS